jgi:hypothetical protein
MKTSLMLLLAAAVSSHASIVQFDISPSGKDAAIGLSPSNQVPVATNSTGSGNEISGGVAFDTDSSKLTLAIGYGSAAGFTDLTGVPTAMHIHGPAGPGTNASVIIDLAAYNFTAPNPSNGGMIVGTITIPTTNISDLLAGLDYINIHTLAYSDGEIRGQLIPVTSSNGPPTISCPDTTTNECGTPSEVTVLVSDPEGDALNVVWTVNGAEVQTNNVAAGTPGASVNVSYSATLAAGTNSIGVAVTDTGTNTTSCGTTVVITDTNKPVIKKVCATPNVLWPANHKLVEVNLTALVQDCGSTKWKIISVSSSEPVTGRGDGNTSPDWQICGDHKVKLRAERSGRSSGRVYAIRVQATDAAGNVSDTATVKVTVPHDQGKGNGRDDDGGRDDNGNHGNGKGGRG